jgi:methylmalonyl-CoA/ethylmalonyl-CoA epimerase
VAQEVSGADETDDVDVSRESAGRRDAHRSTVHYRPMSMPAFDHIAMALPRMADATAVLVGELGGTPHHGGASGPYTFGQWSYAGGGRLEVLEPLGSDGFLHRFLQQRGAGVHHVTFTVPDLDAQCARARARGYRVVGYDASHPSWKEAFLHPKEAQGIVVQFAEAHGGADPSPWDAPAAPPDPPPPVAIVGLRLRSRSREHARRQWGGVLQGAATEGGGELTFRWPGAPMRLVVEIDAAGEEGPVAIEYASDRPVRLPEGPHPLFGVAFRRVAQP